VDPDKKDTLLALAAGRSDMYLFLTAAYAQPPSLELLETIHSEAFLRPFGEIFSADIVTKLRQLGNSDSASALHKQLGQEFMRLLGEPGDSYVMPHESVYRDSPKVGCEETPDTLIGRSARDVQQWYEIAGVELSDDYKDRPDHIALELNYLALLCTKEQHFATAGDDPKLTRVWEMERDFLAGHVVRWVDQLRDRIHEKSQQVYFRAVADMTVEFTHRDLATLEDAIGASDRSSVPEYQAPEP